jgi:hypothetical protein
MRRERQTLPFTWLHQLELRNALRLRVFRSEMTPSQRDASLQIALSDIASGILLPVSPRLSDVLGEAERLSALQTERLGTRTLDIVHVASCIVLGFTHFLSFDARQLRLAKSAGLKAGA